MDKSFQYIDGKLTGIFYVDIFKVIREEIWDIQESQWKG